MCLVVILFLSCLLTSASLACRQCDNVLSWTDCSAPFHCLNEDKCIMTVTQEHHGNFFSVHCGKVEAVQHDKHTVCVDSCNTPDCLHTLCSEWLTEASPGHGHNAHGHNTHAPKDTVAPATDGVTPQTQVMTTIGTAKTTDSQLPPTTVKYMLTSEKQCTDHETDKFKCEHFNRTYNACQSSDLSITTIVLSKCLRYCGLCDATITDSQHLTSTNTKPGTMTEMYTTTQNNLHDTTTGKNVFDTTTGATPAQTQAITTTGTTKTTGSQLQSTNAQYISTTENQCTDHETDMFKCEQFNHTYNACQSSEWSINIIVHSKCLRYCGLCDATTPGSQHLTSSNIKPGTTTETFTTSQNNLLDITTGKNVFDTTTTNYLHHTTTEKQITFSQPKSSTQLHVTQTTDFIVTATSSIRHQTAATTSSLQPNGLGPQVAKNFLTSTDVRSSSHDASTHSMVPIRNNVSVSNTTSDVPFTATSRSMNTFSSTDATTAVDSITTFPSKSTSSSNKTTLGTH